MAYDLEITFWGLNLFVPGAAGNVMTVLMPAAGVPGVEMPRPVPAPSPPQPIPLHLARVYAAAVNLGQPAPPSGTMPLEEVAALEGMQLTLGSQGRPLNLQLPSDLANVSTVADGPLNAALFGTEPGPILTARVILAAGQSTTPASTECWQFSPNPVPQPLTSMMNWTISGMDGDSLELALVPLAGGVPRTVATLNAVNGVISITIVHTEQELLPGNPPPVSPPFGTPADHFAAYYLLFEPLARFGPVPVSAACGNGGSQGAVDLHGHRFGAVPYTCMGPAQADPS